jgi:hypothetical protein
MTLGDHNKDLTFTPLEPCRIFDTRLMGPPPGTSLPAGSPGASRGFIVAGTAGFEFQGGTTGGCGVPLEAASVLINFVALNPAGQGNLKGVQYPQLPASATGGILTYQALTPPLNITNGVLFPICDHNNPPEPEGCLYDINLAANGAEVYVAGTVLGYMRRFPKVEIRGFVTQLQSGAEVGAVIGACGYNTGEDANLTVNTSVSGTLFVRANVMLRVEHTGGGFDDTFNVHLYQDFFGSGGCPATQLTSNYNKVNMGGYFSGTVYINLPLDEVYSVAAGTSRFGIGISGGSNNPAGFQDSAKIYYRTITAMFVPN